MLSLNGRVAIVTGASAGIGAGVARDLAAQGAAVVLNARREGPLKELAATLPAGKSAVVAGDASDDRVINAMLDAARDRFGSGTREADLVVINAGRGLNGSVMTSDTAQWEEMIRTNLLGAAKLIRQAGLRMLRASEGKSGADLVRAPRDMVVLGSTVGRNVSPFSSMYGSTKFGVHGLVEGARRELGPKGIRVTLIAPGFVKSEFQGVAGYDPAWVQQTFDRIGPVLVPEDVARVVTFVASQPAQVHVNDVMLRPTRQDYP
ncbi:MAG: SDR family oxidoreductase [Phycisphaerales bacterium]